MFMDFDGFLEKCKLKHYKGIPLEGQILLFENIIICIIELFELFWQQIYVCVCMYEYINKYMNIYIYI